MAVKEWFRRLRPAPLYLMLAVTLFFFLTQLIMSHMTHALTLLVDAYHMLCNLIALAGCIITIKYGSAESEEEPGGDNSTSAPPALGCSKHDSAGCSEHHNKHHQNEVTRLQMHHHHPHSSSERRLKNTFGWARIDVLVMLIGCVFLASLSFSLVVEAAQTLIHIDHHDEMHHPIPVLVVGVSGLFINALCYLLIGGYTFHQASFLHVNPNGEVVLDHVMNQDSVRKGQRRLSTQTRRPPPPPPYTQRQGPREMMRDIVGCLYVIVCALIVYFTDKEYAKFVDPILSVVSAVTLLILSYPYMRESGCILLQTIPATINIDSLRAELLQAFPDILNVHDLHVWRLTASRVFSTAHIIFLNHKDYSRITQEITDFFLSHGITQVTIQPEFFQPENGNGIVAIPNINDDRCLVPCLGDGCYILHCCANNGTKLSSVVVNPADSQKNEKMNEGTKKDAGAQPNSPVRVHRTSNITQNNEAKKSDDNCEENIAPLEEVVISGAEISIEHISMIEDNLASDTENVVASCNMKEENLDSAFQEPEDMVEETHNKNVDHESCITVSTCASEREVDKDSSDQEKQATATKTKVCSKRKKPEKETNSQVKRDELK